MKFCAMNEGCKTQRGPFNPIIVFFLGVPALRSFDASQGIHVENDRRFGSEPLVLALRSLLKTDWPSGTGAGFQSAYNLTNQDTLQVWKF
jgi:hypothetical protein